MLLTYLLTYLLAVDGWAITFGTAKRGLDGAPARPDPLLAVPNVKAHPSTASVPITVLLYDGPLLCDFNVAIKGLSKPDHICGGVTSEKRLWHFSNLDLSFGRSTFSMQRGDGETADDHFGLYLK